MPIVVAAPNRIKGLKGATFKEVGLSGQPHGRYAMGPKGLPKVCGEQGARQRSQALRIRRAQAHQDTGSQIINNSPEQFAAQDQGPVRGVQAGGGYGEMS